MLPEGIGNPISIALEGENICVIDDRNLLYCSNIVLSYNSESDGKFQSSFYNVPVPDAPIISVSVGGQQSCSLTISGNIWCWSNTPDQNNLFRPLKVISGTDLDAISVISGAEISCAILRDRSVYCWDQDQFTVAGPSKRSDKLLHGPIFHNKSSSLTLGNKMLCSIGMDAEVHCIANLTLKDGTFLSLGADTYSINFNHTVPISISASDNRLCVVDLSRNLTCFDEERESYLEEQGVMPSISIGGGISCFGKSEFSK